LHRSLIKMKRPPMAVFFVIGIKNSKGTQMGALFILKKK